MSLWYYIANLFSNYIATFIDFVQVEKCIKLTEANEGTLPLEVGQCVLLIGTVATIEIIRFCLVNVTFNRYI